VNVPTLQRHKKTGEALTDENGKPLPLTSHTLAPVPVAIGGAGLPDNIVFSKELPDAGLGEAAVSMRHLGHLERTLWHLLRAACCGLPASMQIMCTVPWSIHAKVLLFAAAWSSCSQSSLT
jgi:hypothetical protein